MRIDERKEWNIGGGRNVGSFVSCAPYLLICDMDGYLSTAVLNRTLELVQNGSLGLEESMNGGDVVLPSLYLWNRLIQLNPPIFRHHPAIMLISRHLYWQVQGCDEDFVGHYGKTDVHFRYRAKSIYNVSLNVIPDPLLCRLSVNDNSSEHFSLNEAHGNKAVFTAHAKNIVLNRSAEFNGRLFKMKVSHKIDWNDTIVRFSWHLEHLLPMASDHRTSNDYNSLVVSQIQSQVFITEFWDVANSTMFNSTVAHSIPPSCE
ncbi:hypothetical protein EON65_47295 [archaeon]|nr:MAG: hypothetical protein EON65_47295 [archaeon]